LESSRAATATFGESGGTATTGTGAAQASNTLAPSKANNSQFPKHVPVIGLITLLMTGGIGAWYWTSAADSTETVPREPSTAAVPEPPDQRLAPSQPAPGVVATVAGPPAAEAGVAAAQTKRIAAAEVGLIPVAALSSGDSLVTAMASLGVSDVNKLWSLTQAEVEGRAEWRENPSDVRSDLIVRELKDASTAKYGLQVAFLDNQLAYVGRSWSAAAPAPAGVERSLGAPEERMELPSGGHLLRWNLSTAYLLVYVAPSSASDGEWWLVAPGVWPLRQEAELSTYRAYSHNDRAMALIQAPSPPEEDLASSEELLAKAVELVPQYGRARLRLCKLQIRLNKLELAAATCEAARSSVIPSVRKEAEKQAARVENLRNSPGR
jgi:hypothetical protein